MKIFFLLCLGNLVNFGIIFIIVLELLSIVVAQVIEYIIQEKITLTSKTEEVFKYLNILLTIILVISVVIGGI